MKKTAFTFSAAALLLVFTFSCKNAKKDADAGHNETANVELADEPKTLSQEELLAKGEHLVTTSGCDDCHSPKKYNKGMPEPDMERRLSGHPANFKLGVYDPATVKNGWALTNSHFSAWVGPWGTSFASNLTPDTATGLGNWTEEMFFRALREGKYGGVPEGRMLLPPMPWPDFKNFTDDELRAIFTYLKSIKPVNNPVPAPLPPKGA
jgi:hypothetical protein